MLPTVGIARYRSLTVTSSDARWQTRAACTGTPAERWIRDRGGGTYADERAICATCPVRRDCLDYAMSRCEPFGLWAGANERQRRHLRVRFLQRPHPNSCTEDCGCVWDLAARAHFDSLSVRLGPININGPRATHGARATYARGCRCPRCALSASPLRDRLRAAGVDVPAWWSEWVGDDAADDALVPAKALAGLTAELGVEGAADWWRRWFGPDSSPARDRRLLGYAGTLAAFDLEAA